MTILNAVEVKEVYYIEAIFPFSSDRKRMGIILRHETTGRIVFFLKGAEEIMKDKIKPSMRGTIDEKTDILANDGLRTLVFGYKELTPRQLLKWKHEYEKA
eukprot:CAMPEP_0176394428 /NCGR_PEP_ID=MMETSP0126-20121128/42570_1 /TAXON_ID=141414 ORGANISM="Strombidinopsis acuminatum, Strain SPMC142" /NCGR_SAMPLE_ID=MMETSP0126 /ASSEMBLY_ACC=CAM_ASM_000229 /LENGTH=100 /DNA_ID=CAMNT_0017766639 /DNA_START=957 /DNA_END=1259 /DNA_ORIENTATION=-